jgi:hypothetical protein
VALRHAATDLTATDMTGNLRDCSRQRNLNDEGRRQARVMGRAFRRLEIPVGRVRQAHRSSEHGEGGADGSGNKAGDGDPPHDSMVSECGQVV